MRRRSFTLLEMLVTIALATALLSAMFGFYFDMLSARGRAIEFTARQRAAAMIVERLESDLMTCLVGDDESGAGVSGDESSIHVRSSGVPVQLAERGRDDPLPFGDMLETDIRFDAATGRIEARRSVPDAPNDVAADWSNLGATMYRVRFRYHDGTDWRPRFDSLGSGRLPRAVEIAVWFDPWPGAEPIAAPDASFDDAPPERRTFDATAGFDEQAFAESSDIEFSDEPTPDRIRVIIIPDADTEPPGEEAGP